MLRAATCFTSLLSLIASLGCCCPAAFRPRPVVFAPPQVVVQPPAQQPPVQQPPVEPKPAMPQPARPPMAGARTYDLLPIIDLNWDVVDGKGKWRVQNNELVCHEGNFVPRVQIPYTPPAEYDLVVTFSQPGLRNGISVIMPRPGGGMFFWYLASNGGRGYGFAADPVNKGGDMQEPIKVNTQYTTTVQVRLGGVRGLLNGKVLVDHRTDFRDLKSDGWRQMTNERLLGLACDDPTTFHRIQIVEVKGKGKAIR